MKKLFAVALLIVLLCQVLPVEALAGVGRVLSKDEIARARKLTGLSFGREPASESAYHSGMMPNDGWNAAMLRDWLNDKLDHELSSIGDSFSQAFYMLAEMENSSPSDHKKYTNDNKYDVAKLLAEDTEEKREILRYYEKQLREDAGLIAEMTHWLEEERSSIFDSDAVRYSAKVVGAVNEINDIRKLIVDNAAEWTKDIAMIQECLRRDDDYGLLRPGIKTWIEHVLHWGNNPITDTAPIVRVDASGSLGNRLKQASGLVNDADAQVTVYTDNEVVIQLQAEADGKMVPVDDVPVTFRDALDPSSKAQTIQTTGGAVLVSVNNLTSDEYDVYHLEVTIDPTAQGYQHVAFEDLDLERGTLYSCLLTPLESSAANDDSQRPYPYIMSFGGRDIMKSEYEMIYSPANDYEVEIHLALMNADKVKRVTMRYYDLDGDACDVDPTDTGADLYIFTGPWKQRFSPYATQDQRPAFTIEDAEGKQTFSSQLVSIKSATDEPINEGTGAEGGVFANILGDPLKLSCTIPIINANLSLNLPLTDYLPKLSINPGGYVVTYIGSKMLEDEISKHSVTNWKIRDGKDYQRAQKKVEGEGWFAKYKSDYNQAKDYAKSKGFGLLKETDLHMGWFAVASGRWELDNTIPDILSQNVSLRVGTGITLVFTVSWTATFGIPPFGIPAYVCISLGISGGFATEYTFDFCWVDGKFADWSLRPLDQITIDIGIILAVQAGVGIQGFLDAYAKVAASLDFIINFSLSGPAPSMELWGAIDFTVGATLFFVSASKTWHLANAKLWPSDGAANLLAHYMNKGNDAPEEKEMAYGEPMSYPALTVEAEEKNWTYNAVSDGYPFKAVSVNGHLFAFTIFKATGTDGKTHNRVGYYRFLPKSEEFGFPGHSLQEFVDQDNTNLHDIVNARDDYDFDVCVTDDWVIVAATSAEEFDDDGYPVRNDMSGTSQDQYLNQIVYVMMLQCDGDGNMTYHGENLGLRCQSYQWNMEGEHPDYSYDSLGTPHITCARVTKSDSGDSIVNFEVYGECGCVAYPDDPAPAGSTAFAYALQPSNDFMLFPDRSVTSGMGDGYEFARTVTLLDMDAVGRTGWSDLYDKMYSTSFVGLSRPKNGAEGDSAIELYGFDMNAGGRQAIVLDQGGIDNIVTVKDRDVPEGESAGTMVFYTLKETNGDGAARNRLYGIHIGPVTGQATSDLEYDVTRYEYDAVIPTGNFDICYMDTVPYLYWVTNSPKKNETDPDVWRVWVMLYDSATNSMAPAGVFAEFTLPKIQYIAYHPDGTVSYYDDKPMLKNVMLTDTGAGYLNAAFSDTQSIPDADRPKRTPISLIRFPQQLKPSANLTAAIPEALVVKAGAFDDMTVGVLNDGSLAIATMDLTMVLVDDSGNETPVETVHYDAFHPENNTLTWPDGTMEMSGQEVAWRTDDFENTSRKREWVLDQEALAYKIHLSGGSMTVTTDTIQPSDPQYVATDVLMPGSVGGYVTAIKIPEDWNGGVKTLRMKVSSLSTYANWMRAAALAAGARANGTLADANANGELVELKYVLNERSGKLELQKPANATGALAEALKSGLYATEIETTSVPLTVEVHDLEVDHRVYKGLGGQRWLDIVIRNHAASREGMKLVCAVYVDGAKEPSYINLPCYEDAPLSHKTQTVSLPVSALVDDPSAHRTARVEIMAVGRDERAYANNEFTVYLDGDGSLRIVDQTGDVTVQEGEDVTFDVTIEGGVKPYRYQWQMWDEKHQKWVDLKGFTEPTMSRDKIEKVWDGCKFRCVVTDATGAQVISGVMTLTVRDKVPTGDDSHLTLYLAVALAVLALLIAIRRKYRGA